MNLRDMNVFADMARAWRSLSATGSSTLAVAVLLTCVAVAVSFGRDGMPPPPGGGGGGDAVGSLPAMGPDNGLPGYNEDGTKSALLFRPALALIGHIDNVRNAVLDAAGNGHVVVVPLDDAGQVEMIFVGQVSVWLDPVVLGYGRVQVLLESSPTWGASVAKFALSGSTILRSKHAAGDVPLDVVALANSGALDQGALDMHVTNKKKAKQSLTFTALPHAIRVDQQF